MSCSLCNDGKIPFKHGDGSINKGMKIVQQRFSPEEIEDIRQIVAYLRDFSEIWNACELREYSYQEIKKQAIDEFLRRKYIRGIPCKKEDGMFSL